MKLSTHRKLAGKEHKDQVARRWEIGERWTLHQSKWNNSIEGNRMPGTLHLPLRSSSVSAVRSSAVPDDLLVIREQNCVPCSAEMGCSGLPWRSH
jgi:hypothetical protein